MVDYSCLSDFLDGKLDDERRIHLEGDPIDFEENDGRCYKCN